MAAGARPRRMMALTRFLARAPMLCTRWGELVRVFIVFRDSIYASGLRAILSVAPGVEVAGHAGSIANAWDDNGLALVDLIILDDDLGGALAFIEEVKAEHGVRVLLCVDNPTAAEVLDAVAKGAAGTLGRDVMTPDTLIAAVAAVAAGLYAFDSQAIRALTSAASPNGNGNHLASVGGPFSAREQVVLRLVAAGLSNREIADRLSYSERTIKTVLHDIVTKLGVKSRSQAVAMAVRDRMI
jgi:DNA-binding NarL/FixJ family response regulator